MQTLTELLLDLAPPGGLFDETVLQNLFPAASNGARAQLVFRARRAGEILRLKPGIYCLAPRYRAREVHPFVVAGLLHAPSHVSLESALAFHGLIPEAITQVSSVTVSRSRTLRTPLGVFSYHRVPAGNPRAGVRAVKVDDRSWAFVASPLRAIADLIHLHKEVTWASDGLDYLQTSLRFEERSIGSLPLEDFDAVRCSLGNRRVRQYLDGLQREVARCSTTS